MTSSHKFPPIRFFNSFLLVKVSVWVFLFLVILIIAQIALIVPLTQKAIYQNIEKNQLQIANEVMGRIDSYLYERLVDVKAISADRILVDSLNNKINYPESTISAQLSDSLTQWENVSGPWESITVTDVQGKVYGSTIEEATFLENYQTVVGEEPYLKASQGQTYYSDAQLHSLLKKPTLFISSPIKDFSQQGDPVVGVLFASIAWPSVEEFLKNLSMQAYLVNSSSQVIASSEFRHKQHFLQDLSFSPSLMKAKEQEQGTMKYYSSSDKEEVLTSFVKQPGYLEYEGSGWVLNIEVPTREAYASVDLITRNIILTMVGLVSVGLSFLLLFFHRVVIRQISRITQIAKRIAEGELNERLVVKSEDELGILSESFNTMTTKLSDLYTGMEEKVTLRTKELEETKKLLEVKLNEQEKMNLFMVDRELKMGELKDEIKRLKGIE